MDRLYTNDVDRRDAARHGAGLVGPRTLTARYKSTGTPTVVSMSDFQGDRIDWDHSSHDEIEVYRDSDGWQFPLAPGFEGNGVDLTVPGQITFTPALIASERVIVKKRFASQINLKPLAASYYTERFTVVAAATQSTFYLTRPGKATFFQGRNRGQTVSVIVDGKIQIPNTPGTTDGDYDEDLVTGTDSFTSVTFNVPVTDALRDIKVVIDHKGFYDSDNISTSQLVALQDSFDTSEIVVQRTRDEIVGPSSVGSATVPWDNSLPLSSEGNLVFTRAFTPKFSDSKIRIHFWSWYSTGAGSTGATIAYILIDGTTVAVSSQRVTGINEGRQIEVDYEYAPGSVTPVTITVRMGNNPGAGGNINLNTSWTGNEDLGSAGVTYLLVEEIR